MTREEFNKILSEETDKEITIQAWPRSMMQKAKPGTY